MRGAGFPAHPGLSRGSRGGPGRSKGGPRGVQGCLPCLGGKGEVKPPKCPTRHPRVGGFGICLLYRHLLLPGRRAAAVRIAPWLAVPARHAFREGNFVTQVWVSELMIVMNFLLTVYIAVCCPPAPPLRLDMWKSWNWYDVCRKRGLARSAISAC